MREIFKDSKEASASAIAKYQQHGAFLVYSDGIGTLFCADNIQHAKDMCINLASGGEFTLVATDQNDLSEIEEEWAMDIDAPCPPITVMDNAKE